MPRGWLRHTRSRDLLLIFAGLFGLIIIASIASTKYTSDQERRKTLAEQERQQTRREKERQEARERERQETEERQAREAYEHRRRERLEELRLAGVRAIAFSPTKPVDSVGVWLTLRSVTEEADVFLDWTFKGRTPLLLNGVTLSGLLVVAKDGYQPWFQEINYREDRDLPLALTSRTSYPSQRLLLVPQTPTTPTTLDQLRTKLAEGGFSIPSGDDIRAFEEAERSAGGLTNIALCAWARGRFDTKVLIKAKIREEQRDLAAQSPILGGTVRVVVYADLDVYDLVRGKHVTLISATGSAFALDHARALEQAMTKMAHEAAAKLKPLLE
jgi:hypothetical protein